MKKSNEKNKRNVSKGEQIILKIGLWVIFLTLGVVGFIIFTSLNSLNVEVEDPLLNFVHVDSSDLQYIIGENDIGSFGTFEYFISDIEKFNDIYEKIINAQVIYILFYSSSEMNLRLMDYIDENFSTLNEEAFLVLDLDSLANASLYDNPVFSNNPLFNPDINSNQGLITFYVEGFETDDGLQFFDDHIWYDIDNIIKSLELIQ